MSNTPSYFDEALTVIPSFVTFTTASGVATAPASVTCIVADPDDNQYTFTFVSGSTPVLNAIYNPGTGKYELDLQPFHGTSPFTSATPPAELWHVTWVGSGGSVASGVQVFAQSFRVFPLFSLVGQQRWYAGLEEMKSRLGIPFSQLSVVTTDDYEMTLALQMATAWINDYCATHFFKVAETRTFAPVNIWNMPVDQHVKGSITSFRIDTTGNGTFDTAWTEGVNFQTYIEGFPGVYNPNHLGIPEPLDFVEVLMNVGGGGGQFFPFTWPFAHKDRVQVAATWGWPEIPPNVNHACLLLAVHAFKMKDAPWGIAGSSDLGMVKIQPTPMIVELLRKYVNVRNKVGV